MLNVQTKTFSFGHKEKSDGEGKSDQGKKEREWIRKQIEIVNRKQFQEKENVPFRKNGKAKWRLRIGGLNEKKNARFWRFQ